jgi:ParB family transcriptional regulator, chromosome partitioning protein
MTSRKADAEQAFIPLNLLKKSPKNVRKVPHTKDYIASLADNIEANGQLQNLVVEPETDGDGKPTGAYLVNIGEGRRLAQLLRVKRKKIAADEPIRCVIDAAHDGRQVSLAENVIREAMHPADQYEAFKALVDSGRTIEDVAEQFGVKPLIVQRRLKLANVAPMFLELYRKGGEITLEHLMAFAVTDDHERQQQVWAGLKKWDRTPHGVRAALTEHEISTKSPLARFVGDAYAKSGGVVRRDLFSTEDEGFIVDPELLKRLVNEKLEKAAGRLRTKSCAWVEVRPQLDYAELAKYGRVGTVRRPPTDEEAAKLKELAAQVEDIEQQMEGLAEEDERLDALEAKADELREAEQEIEDACDVPDPAQQPVSGAIVSIERDGKLHVEQGLLKPEDKARFARSRKNGANGKDHGDSTEAPRVHSAALTRRLTAHRTMALQATLAQRPDVALVALTHRLISQRLMTFDPIDSALEIDTRTSPLEQFAADVKGSKAHQALEAQRERVMASLPAKPDELLGWLMQRPQQEVLMLLAFCVALTVNGVQHDESPGAAHELAVAAGLNMRQWWSATAESYFGSVPKSRVLDVVREAVSPEIASSLANLKKTPLASAAEKRIAETGWLPEVLRTSAPETATAA